MNEPPVHAHGEGKPAIVAFLDLGTNALRGTVVSFAVPSAPEVLALERVQVRLGAGAAPDGSLGGAAMGRAVGACARVAREARALGAHEIVAVATAAVRDAPNGPELVAWLRDVAGVEIRVLSGDEEAALVYRGVVACARPQAARVCCLDIGGGSTEFVVGESGRVGFSRSVPVGAVRLAAESGLLDEAGGPDGGPVDDARYEGLKDLVRDLLRPAAAEVAHRAPQAVYGVAGTLRTLAIVADMARGWSAAGAGSGAAGAGRDAGVAARQSAAGEPAVLRLSRDDVAATAGMLRRERLQARREIPGLEPERADVIVPGAAIAEVVYDLLGLDEIAVVLACGVRDGLIAEYADRLRATDG